MKEENINTCAIRLQPGEDIKQGIEKSVKENSIQAGWISAAVGSLIAYTIRFANQSRGSTANGYFEIISLTGTLSTNGSHLHIGLSDGTGKMIGGHLLEGCKVYTTAEIIIQYSNKYVFTREKDGTTSWEELQIRENKE